MSKLQSETISWADETLSTYQSEKASLWKWLTPSAVVSLVLMASFILLVSQPVAGGGSAGEQEEAAAREQEEGSASEEGAASEQEEAAAREELLREAEEIAARLNERPEEPGIPEEVQSIPREIVAISVGRTEEGLEVVRLIEGPGEPTQAPPEPELPQEMESRPENAENRMTDTDGYQSVELVLKQAIVAVV